MDYFKLWFQLLEFYSDWLNLWENWQQTPAKAMGFEVILAKEADKTLLQTLLKT